MYINIGTIHTVHIHIYMYTSIHSCWSNNSAGQQDCRSTILIGKSMTKASKPAPAVSAAKADMHQGTEGHGMLWCIFSVRFVATQKKWWMTSWILNLEYHEGRIRIY